MDNYGNYYQKPKKPSKFSYFLVAIIGAIIGGIITAYVAPTYLYGNIIPLPEIYQYNSEAPIINTIDIKPTDEINTVSAVAKKGMSSVVGITTIQVQQEFIWSRTVEGVGSGVIVDSNGYILTNSHVIADGKAREINVLFENGDSKEAEVIWYDPTLDLAIIKVNARNLIAAELGDSDKLEVGEIAIAIGNPLGLEFQRTVTAGVISGLHRSIQVTRYNVMEDLIQTDASINPGNSGGPLLNAKGQVIGINTAKIQTGEGLGFSIPINTVKPIIESVIRDKNIEPVSLGISGSDIDLYERQMGAEIKAEKGVLVVEVIPDSPADKAGIKPMDVITKLGDKEISSLSALRKELYNYQSGDKVEIEINRNGEILNLTIEFE
ncbi:PDZ domain-containing protein [Soehngenia longivitae]|uniref:PDZ domain-containing protein n=1 Tax=Soehngenia longivitae TaxID=2562294 RepID=A0A4Z0D8X1_9FIRM|nr:trypsin-like peptidase domain-containing protein [Soehngenia longivitae]TFZ41324.1 PDZ domain-containing protein [Soehngenia longivitae]